MTRKNISNFIMMGDSLSDRGTMNHRRLFYFIPMSILAGLAGRAPVGRFTNGFAWSDHISAMLANEFIVENLRQQRKMDNTDIADAVIAGEYRVQDQINNSYNLGENGKVTFEGREFVRCYQEGGLTSKDYSWKLSWSISRFFSRLILATLKHKRDELLASDYEAHQTRAHKAETLVVEWSGANDLITVNAEPSELEAYNAVRERIKNIEKLARNGYRNFILFNLPDLSLTPRFQNRPGVQGQRDRDNASHCCDFFNYQLTIGIQRIRRLYPHCSIDIFDVNSIFRDAHARPEAYGFEPEKLRQPFTTSEDFVITDEHTSPARGYMFWDDVHPTADLHACLGEQFYQKYRLEYNFKEPDEDDDHHFVQKNRVRVSEESLKAAFVCRYGERLAKERHRFLGQFRHEGFDYRHASLIDILRHGLQEGGERTKKVLMDLHWVDKHGQLILNAAPLANAMQQIKPGSRVDSYVYESDPDVLSL